MQPCEKFGGNQALTANRGRSIPTRFPEMSHEGFHVNVGRAISGRGQSLLDMSAFLEKAREHQNTTSLLGKLLSKQVVAVVQVSLFDFFNLANISPLQVLGNLGGHPQLVSGRPPRILLSAQPVGITIHQRPQHR
jgi:hypothetical protein